MNPRPIVLDCDPGHDDALAITLALARPELELLGITTVGGNSPLANTTRNALRALALLGRSDVPVAAGGERALVREPWTPVEFHGETVNFGHQDLIDNEHGDGYEQSCSRVGPRFEDAACQQFGLAQTLSRSRDGLEGFDHSEDRAEKPKHGGDLGEDRDHAHSSSQTHENARS